LNVSTIALRNSGASIHPFDLSLTRYLTGS
jgi:hypothetical protein